MSTNDFEPFKRLTTEELVKYSEKELKSIVNESLTKAAFEYYDLNKKDKIEEVGMKKLCLELTGEDHLTNEQIKAKFTELGFDTKDSLTYDEFRALFRKVKKIDD